MTIIAGVFCLTKNKSPPKELCNSLHSSISRFPSDIPVFFQDDYCYLLKIDIDAYGETAHCFEGNRSASIMAGEPLLPNSKFGYRRSRQHDLDEMHRSWETGDWSLLTETHGSFCAAYYDATHPSLTLVADKLGVRSLYYWKGRDLVVFASALRVLESVAAVPKTMSVRGVGEISAFGYCLGERTPYVDIKCLDAGQVVRIGREGKSAGYYWSWDKIPRLGLPRNEVAEVAHHRFCTAVQRRLKKDEDHVIAFLSGGLDSRIVTAVLAEQHRTVHTYSFSHKGTLDHIISAAFADAMGTVHRQSKQGMEPFTPPAMYLGREVSNIKNERLKDVRRPRLAWSGDGGSVGVGFVYLNSDMVDSIRQNDVRKAVQNFRRYNDIGIPQRILNRRLFLSLEAMISRGIEEGLKRFECGDPGQKLYLFLLYNDQRRHLFKHFENIDINRIELHLPFFDSLFLQSLLEIPSDYGIYHMFYNNWLAEFPHQVKSVPWQYYPGHVPCPLPLPEEAVNQWSATYNGHLKKIVDKKAREIEDALREGTFPTEILDKRYLFIYKWICKLGLS